MEGEVVRLETLLHQVSITAPNQTAPNGAELQVQLRLDESESLREEVNNAFAELKDGGTPRPDWQRYWRASTASLSKAKHSRAFPRCSKVVEGGEQRWRKVCKGRSSDQLVRIYTWVRPSGTEES